MKDKNIGFAITGSFCTFTKILPCVEKLAESNNIIPIFSYSVRDTDTRFYKAADFSYDIEFITGKKPITTICDAEPIGPKCLLDLLIIAPCTGNTLTKLNHAITDTPVLMAAKAHLRNNKPVLIAISTNDGLSNNARNFGDLINKKNIYFVPFLQDDSDKKPYSLVADFDLLKDAAEAALEGRQLQPVMIGL
ncbi:MAG: dipicolinate synthase subunit B [Clostridia bacterium]|nr:dipicolinate synthase subunit B [Clostridia bacterium]